VRRETFERLQLRVYRFTGVYFKRHAGVSSITRSTPLKPLNKLVIFPTRTDASCVESQTSSSKTRAHRVDEHKPRNTRGPNHPDHILKRQQAARQYLRQAQPNQNCIRLYDAGAGNSYIITHSSAHNSWCMQNKRWDDINRLQYYQHHQSQNRNPKASL
jgi:hypothetical protein